LEIEFYSNIQDNQNVSHWYSINQIITSEQANNNQELQEVKNYLQKTGKDSLNQSELGNIFNSNSAPTETPKGTNKSF